MDGYRNPLEAGVKDGYEYVDPMLSPDVVAAGQEIQDGVTRSYLSHLLQIPPEAITDELKAERFEVAKGLWQEMGGIEQPTAEKVEAFRTVFPEATGDVLIPIAEQDFEARMDAGENLYEASQNIVRSFGSDVYENMEIGAFRRLRTILPDTMKMWSWMDKNTESIIAIGNVLLTPEEREQKALKAGLHGYSPEEARRILEKEELSEGMIQQLIANDPPPIPLTSIGKLIGTLGGGMEALVEPVIYSALVQLFARIAGGALAGSVVPGVGNVAGAMGGAGMALMALGNSRHLVPLTAWLEAARRAGQLGFGEFDSRMAMNKLLHDIDPSDSDILWGRIASTGAGLTQVLPLMGISRVMKHGLPEFVMLNRLLKQGGSMTKNQLSQKMAYAIGTRGMTGLKFTGEAVASGLAEGAQELVEDSLYNIIEDQFLHETPWFEGVEHSFGYGFGGGVMMFMGGKAFRRGADSLEEGVLGMERKRKAYDEETGSVERWKQELKVHDTYQDVLNEMKTDDDIKDPALLKDIQAQWLREATLNQEGRAQAQQIADALSNKTTGGGYAAFLKARNIDTTRRQSTDNPLNVDTMARVRDGMDLLEVVRNKEVEELQLFSYSMLGKLLNDVREKNVCKR